MAEKSWKPAAMAAASGIDQSLIGRYLSGECEIGEKNAPAIAKALGISLVELMFGDPAEASSPSIVPTSPTSTAAATEGT